MKKIYSDRQGDVLLLAVATLPADAQEQVVEGRIVLKHGEVTGHAHAFYAQPVRLYQTPKKERFLRVVETSYLKHEEHTTVEVPPGLYKLPEQVEWTDQDEPRVVAD